MNEQQQFAVVINREAQYSIWPADQDLPAGWDHEFTGSRESCLSHIKQAWSDIRGKSVRTSHRFGMPQSKDESWLPSWCAAPQPTRGSVVFCFPYAAGGAHSYLAWSQASQLQLLPLAYPGRGERSDEAFINDMGTLAERIADFVTSYAQRHRLESFSFFGHSMGALVAFATALNLHKSKRKTPRLLAASASPAPHLPIVNPLAGLGDEDLLEAIANLQDPQVRGQSPQQLHGVFLPILRNDLRICEAYQPSVEERVGCPILAVAADDDPRVDFGRVEKWAELTTGRIDIQTVRGGHFYFERDAGSINTALEEALGAL